MEYLTNHCDKLEQLCDFSSSGWLGTPRFGWPGNSKPKVPFIRQYFETLPMQFHLVNYKSIVHNLHSKVDFGFKWRSEDPVNCLCIEDIIDNFEKFVIDDFGHLGIQGSELVADWVEQEFLIPNKLI